MASQIKVDYCDRIFVSCSSNTTLCKCQMSVEKEMSRGDIKMDL